MVPNKMIGHTEIYTMYVVKNEEIWKMRYMLQKELFYGISRSDMNKEEKPNTSWNTCITTYPEHST